MQTPEYRTAVTVLMRGREGERGRKREGGGREGEKERVREGEKERVRERCTYLCVDLK